MSDSRLEKYINAILSMEVSDLPAPLSRNETYLMAILGLYDIDNLPAPLSRVEKLLYEIATTITVTPSVDLSYSFMDETSGYAYGSVALSSNDTTNDGTYTICWADANGKLNDYKDIASFTLSGSMVVTYEFISTNIIPKEATRVVAIKDGLIKASYRIETNRLNTDTKLYSIGLLSDIHIDVTDDQSDSVADFQRAINRFKTENVIAICSTGDTVVDGSQKETEKFIEIKNSANIPMYIARGNHDCRSYSLANWNLVEPNGVYFEKEIGGDIYLFMGMNAEDFNTSLFTTEQLNWLEERLEYYKNRRVFLFEHVFIEPTGNIKSLYPYSSMGKVEGQPGQMFRNLMAKYRNVILFTGHSHLEFILQRLGAIANCSERTNSLCHRVHIPSCAKPRANDETTEDVSANTYSKYGSSEGYVMDVYQDYIILKGINFVDNKYLPLAQYRINTTPIIDDTPTDEALLFYLDGSSSENTTSLIKDLSGNGNDFTATNIVLNTENGSITFNGNGYLINETLKPIQSADGSFSFEFVAECTKIDNSSNGILSLGTTKPGRLAYRLNCVDGDDNINAEIGDRTSLVLTSTASGTVETDFNKKHHIIIVKTANQVTTYLDGKLNKTVTMSEGTATFEPRTIIGAKYNHTANFFNGEVYMCKLYGRDLSAEEVLEKYYDYMSETNLLFHLDGFNSENTTSLIKDLSGNGNDFVANNIELDTANGAINFNGSSSYLINETLQPVSTADDIFSVEFIVDSNAVCTDSQSMISLGTSSPNRITYRYKGTESAKNIFTDYGATNNIDITAGSDTDLSKKRHIVIIRKNGYISCYVDGALNKQCVKAEDTTTIEPRTVIGAKYNYTANFFNGNIYMCKLYTRELSAKEILEKYNDIINIQYATYKITNALETLSNTKEKPIKSIILKGSTKYRDNDTQEVLDTFKDGRNLELVSAKKLILKTSNEGGTKTNILTVSSDATLRKIGTVQDDFNALTGEITERIGEIILNGSEDWIVDSDTNSTRSAFALAHNGMMKKYEAILCDKYKPTTAKQGSTVYGYVYIGSSSINLYEEPNMSLDTFKAKLASNPITIQYPLVTESTKTVDLSIIDQNGNNINTLNTFSDITRIEIKSEYILPEVEIEVAINKN